MIFIALFLIDAEDCVYLWQGWFPVETNDSEDTDGDIVTTGSGQVRWQAERRAAMQTLLSYRSARWSRAGQPPAKLVWAGHEDKQFRNMFPEWTHNEDVARINKEVRSDTTFFRALSSISLFSVCWQRRSGEDVCRAEQD